jgi:hypothetical protein
MTKADASAAERAPPAVWQSEYLLAAARQSVENGVLLMLLWGFLAQLNHQQ